MSLHRTALLAAAAFGIVLAAPAAAQDGTAGAPPQNDNFSSELNRDTITLGVAAAAVPDYEGSNDYRIVPGPAAIGSFKGFSFSVIGNRASIDLIPNKPGPTWDFQLGPVGVINFNRSSRDSIDDDRVARLPERKTAVELGGYVGIGKTGVITSPYDKLSVSVSYRHDISGVSHGEIWQPTLNYLTPLSRKAAVGLFASAQHADRDYAQTYFGVTTGEAVTSGLTPYNARAGWKNYTLGALATYSLTGDLLHGFKVVAGGTYSRLLNSYSYSPLIRTAGSPNQWLGAVGIAYTF